MTTAAIREKLYDYIRGADDKKIKAIYTILEDQIVKGNDWSQDVEFIAELDERVKRWEDGTDKAYTWNELEASIKVLKDKRAVKK